jgi:hypothetical protein
MKAVSILTVLSALCGSSLTMPYRADDDYSADNWSDMNRDTEHQWMNRLKFFKKEDLEVNEPDYAGAMDIVSEKLDAAVDQAMAHLNSVLMLKDSTKVSAELRSKMTEFKESLVKHFELDVTEVANAFKEARVDKGPLTDEEKYEFSDLLKHKWEQTLTADLDTFQRNILPRWVSGVRNTWKGVEKMVMEKIEKFRKFIHKTIPRTSDTCSLPSSVLVGTNAISAASSRLRKTSMQRMDGGSGLTVAGKVAIFILAIIGVITLAIGAPFFFFFLGVFWLTDRLSDLIFGPNLDALE